MKCSHSKSHFDNMVTSRSFHAWNCLPIYSVRNFNQSIKSIFPPRWWDLWSWWIFPNQLTSKFIIRGPKMFLYVFNCMNAIHWFHFISFSTYRLSITSYKILYPLVSLDAFVVINWAPKRLRLDLSIHKNMYLNYILPFSANHVINDVVKINFHSTFQWVELLDDIEKYKSKYAERDAIRCKYKLCILIINVKYKCVFIFFLAQANVYGPIEIVYIETHVLLSAKGCSWKPRKNYILLQSFLLVNTKKL